MAAVVLRSRPREAAGAEVRLSIAEMTSWCTPACLSWMMSSVSSLKATSWACWILAMIRSSPRLALDSLMMSALVSWSAAMRASGRARTRARTTSNRVTVFIGLLSNWIAARLSRGRWGNWNSQQIIYVFPLDRVSPP